MWKVTSTGPSSTISNGEADTTSDSGCISSITTTTTGVFPNYLLNGFLLSLKDKILVHLISLIWHLDAKFILQSEKKKKEEDK